MSTIKYKNSRNKGDIAIINLDTETQDIPQPLFVNRNDAFSRKTQKHNSEVLDTKPKSEKIECPILPTNSTQVNKLRNLPPHNNNNSVSSESHEFKIFRIEQIHDWEQKLQSYKTPI